MLLNLHVKNLALIEKADVEFGSGLNILTGETGAGKSIIIGSINIALGGKVPRDIVRKGAEYAYIELVFLVDDQEKRNALRDMDVYLTEDNMLIISKKITPSRSVSKINDETVTAAKLKEITSLLLDIHGQHEHQSLLYKSKHLEILDEYARVKTQPLKLKTAECYGRYTDSKARLETFSMDEESRMREADFIRFEIGEIEDAALRPGEEEELAERLKKMNNYQKIASGLSQAHEYLERSEIGRALKQLTEISELEQTLQDICAQLYDAESILNDASRDMSAYLDDMSFDEEEFYQVEARLNQIRALQAKYGGTTERVIKAFQQKQQRLEELENYTELQKQAEADLIKNTRELEASCEQWSMVRKESAKGLTEDIKNSLSELNFLGVEFFMVFRQLPHFTANGWDEAEFQISTNPGETAKPLGMVASGGELSRIMLAIKTVLADTDQIPTLIFDEIDAGISGRTAQMVSEKLVYISGKRQIICITHLPQIAAMADQHFEIKKQAEHGKTVTRIEALKQEEQVMELARLLGGAQITDAVVKNAREMKELAVHLKKITTKN